MKSPKILNFSSRKPSILAVFAHPDDESFLAGGTLAYYARNGVTVKLLCLTHGEKGYSDKATAYERQVLPHIRQAELARCCEVLGIQLLPLLDFPDGKLGEFKAATLARPIAQAIRQHQPEIVLTFGADALTRHPDHLAIHHATTLAFQDAARPGTALFYAGLSEYSVSRLSTRLEGSLGGIPLMLTAAPKIELDTVINVEAFSSLKWAALACHRTQAAGLQNLNQKDFEILGQKEFFQLKKVAGAYPVSALRSVRPGPCATDLFERIGLCDQLLEIA
jgi:LmbE family N-acetylglucosaminyl deacetylase